MTAAAEEPRPSDDSFWMQQALCLAAQGLGAVEPNPLVGCVLVSHGQCIGQGFHARYGEAHAERAAVAAARQAGLGERLRGCTAYVTLEPCCHQGKTPPCTELLLEVGVGRVVVAMEDPFEAVRGGGLSQLREAGVAVQVGVQAEAAARLNAAYVKRIRQHRPWVIAKWAMSLDGRIATGSGHSHWISSPPSRLQVHRLRSRVDAILIGSGTALADDPLLTTRLPSQESVLRTALRVVVDSNLALKPQSRLAQTADQVPLLLWAGPHADAVKADQLRRLGCQVELSEHDDPAARLDALLRYLAQQRSATNVLVEGGGRVLGSLFDLRQIDQCEIFIAPKLIGGATAISPIAGVGSDTVSAGPLCHDFKYAPCGEDLQLSCRVSWPSGDG